MKTHLTQRRVLPPFLVPLAVAITLLATTLVLAFFMSREHDANFRGILEIEAEKAAERLQGRLALRVGALRRWAARLEFNRGLSREHWGFEAQAYLEDFGVFHALGFVDSDYLVRWVEPQAGNEELSGSGFGWRAECLEIMKASQESRQLTTTPPLPTSHDELGFQVFAPLFWDDQFQGFAFASFGFDDLRSLLSDAEERVGVCIRDGSEEVYCSIEGTLDEDKSSFKTVDLPQRRWRLRVAPKTKQGLSLPALGLLVFCLVTTVVLPWALSLWFRSETRVLESQSRFRAAFEGAPNPTLIVDSKGVIVHANEQTARDFGYALDEILGQPIELFVPEEKREVHVAHRKRYMRDAQIRQMGVTRDLVGVR